VAGKAGRGRGLLTTAGWGTAAALLPPRGWVGRLASGPRQRRRFPATLSPAVRHIRDRVSRGWGWVGGWRGGGGVSRGAALSGKAWRVRQLPVPVPPSRGARGVAVRELCTACLGRCCKMLWLQCCRPHARALPSCHALPVAHTAYARQHPRKFSPFSHCARRLRAGSLDATSIQLTRRTHVDAHGYLPNARLADGPARHVPRRCTHTSAWERWKHQPPRRAPSDRRHARILVPAEPPCCQTPPRQVDRCCAVLPEPPPSQAPRSLAAWHWRRTTASAYASVSGSVRMPCDGIGIGILTLKETRAPCATECRVIHRPADIQSLTVLVLVYWYWYIDAKGNSSAMRHRIQSIPSTS